MEQGDGDGHSLRNVVQADGHGGQNAGPAHALNGHAGAHCHAHRDIVEGYGGCQHDARCVQVVVAAGALVGVVVVLMVLALIDPAVQEVGDAEPGHQA